MVVNNLVSRGLSTVRRIVSGKDDVDLSPRLLDKIRTQLTECVEGLGGEVSARQRAARLAHTYLQLDDEGRHAFLKLIALEFGPDPKQVAKAHESYQAAVGTAKQWDAEAGLRMAMRSRRIRILTQFNAIPQGVKFLVDMRVDLLRFLKQDNELQALDRELENRLSAWFDVGFLELQRITWNSPAALLEASAGDDLEGPSRHNQAMMELGALVCVPAQAASADGQSSPRSKAEVSTPEITRWTMASST